MITKQEIVQIMTLLAGNYESIANKSNIQRKTMLDTWYECLNDLDYNVVLKAVKKSIIESPYPPTIHDIRKNAVEIINPSDNRTPIEAWQEAYQMICSGTYMTQEDFDLHSNEVKRFFGSVENLRSYSTNEDFNIDVVRSNFISQYDRICKNIQETKMIPSKILQLGECIKKIND